jgi:hypothetical protein
MSALRAHQIAILLAVTLGGAAHAQSGITREQVKAELAQAIRDGNMIGDGNTGQTLRELNPQRYPAIPRVGSSREQVKAELAQARATGQLSTGGDLNIAADQASANKSQGLALAQGKTRAEVLAELHEAIRTGNISEGGETDRLLKDLYPKRYADVRPASEMPMTAASSPNRILQ